MAVQVVRFRFHEGVLWGVKTENGLAPLEGFNEKSLPDFIALGGLEKAAAVGAVRGQGMPALKVEDVEILSPVTYPCAITCQGLNYREHIAETTGSFKDGGFNLFFAKASSSLTGPNGPIVRPSGVELLDYELELGFVIKKRINHPLVITERDLPDLIAGLVMGNDVSARDVQIPEEQWFHGKSYRGFCPVGPFLCLLNREEWKRLNDLKLELRVNGEVRQSARVQQMIHPIHETLKQLSEFMDLMPGDLVLSGTPSGVALQLKGSILPKLAKAFLLPEMLRKKLVQAQLKSGRFLNEGDLVTSTIRTEDGAIDLGQQRISVR